MSLSGSLYSVGSSERSKLDLAQISLSRDDVGAQLLDILGQAGDVLARNQDRLSMENDLPSRDEHSSLQAALFKHTPFSDFWD